MLRRTAQLSVGLILGLSPALLAAQANPPQYFIFCAAQAPPAVAGAPATVYYSGILQGTAANLQAFRTDFAQFLMQRYAFKGGANCAPRPTMADAQTVMNNQETAFRNAKRNVVQTGWTESGGGAGGGVLGGITNPLSSILNGGQPTTTAPATQTKPATTTGQTTAPATQGQATGRGGTGGGNAGGNQSAFGNVFGQIFGTGGGGSGGGGTGGKQGQAQTTGAGKPGTGTTGGTGGAPGAGGAGGGGGSNQSPFSQVSGVIFGNRGGGNGGGNNGGGNGGGRGGQPGQPGQPGGANTVAENNGGARQPGAPGGPGAKPEAPQTEGVLGSAQFGTTKLDIYGCARQDTQVACIAQLTNQNPKETLVKSADIWKDTFIVDDRGDRHTRSNAFFLNIDGEQRPQLDISNGRSAKFVLMFDQVPTKVQKVTLRSQTGGLAVEEIGLLAADGSSPAATTASAPSGR